MAALQMTAQKLLTLIIIGERTGSSKLLCREMPSERDL